MAEKSPGHRRRRKSGPHRQSDPGKTGRALRQQFTTPDVETLFAQQAASARALNGPAVPQGRAAATPARPTRTVFSDKEVLEIYDLVRSGDAVRLVTDLCIKRKKKPGRPAAISFTALIVGMLLTAVDGSGCLMSEVANTLYRRLSPAMMNLLDIKPLPELPVAGSNDSPFHDSYRKQQQRIARRVQRRFEGFRMDIDPSIYPSGRNRTWEELQALRRDLRDDQVETRMNALTVVCNDIVRIAWRTLPESARRRHDGSVGIDATPVGVWSTGRRADDIEASAEVDAAYYVRTGDHREPTGDRKSTNAVSKKRFAYDLHLMIAADATLDPRTGQPSERQYLPALPVGMFMTRPGENPAGSFRRMATNLTSWGWQPGYLAGDGAYADANANGFHVAARKLGWKLVLPVLNDHVGVQAVINSYKVIEGWLYCPSIPTDLINATRDMRDGTIDADEYERRIKDRQVFAVRLHNDLGDFKLSLGCPAYGTKAKVMCENKPRSEAPERHQLISGPQIKMRPRIYPDPEQNIAGQLPDACLKQTMTIDLAAQPAAKYLQDVTFGTHQHTNIYNALRQSQEGFHGFAKDQGYENLDAPGLRRVPGLAAHFVMVAVMVAASGIRKVRSFLLSESVDEDGDHYVRRRKRKGEHASTLMPPGSPGARGDPEYDASLDDA